VVLPDGTERDLMEIIENALACLVLEMARLKGDSIR